MSRRPERRRARALRRQVARLAATAPMSWLFARVARPIDSVLARRGRRGRTLTNMVAGLPVVWLTTTGAKTGRERTIPVVGLVDGDNVVVIASNFGRRHHPGWYHNLRATPAAAVRLHEGDAPRQVRAREATGEERSRIWEHALRVYPGWRAYERRATRRTIAVFVLEPAAAHPAEAAAI